MCAGGVWPFLSKESLSTEGADTEMETLDGGSTELRGGEVPGETFLRLGKGWR
jgi:hypothetical protein